jgi:hypothetical protein
VIPIYSVVQISLRLRSRAAVSLATILYAYGGEMNVELVLRLRNPQTAEHSSVGIPLRDSYSLSVSA